MTTAVLVDYIDQHRGEFGVEPICTVLRQAGMPIEVRLNAGRVPDHEKTEPGMPLECQGRTGNHNRRPLVAAHSVERYRARHCHRVFALYACAR